MRSAAAAAAVAALLLTTLGACSDSPIAPTPTPPALDPAATFDGFWTIQYRTTACGGERHCVLFLGGTGGATLAVTRSGSGFDGVITVNSETVTVRGGLDANGDLLLTGIRPRVLPTDLEVEVTRFRLRSTSAGISGDLEFHVRGTPMGNFFGNAFRRGEFISAERVRKVTPLDVRFGGTWSGLVVVRDCAFVGWLWCYPLERERLQRFQLTLAERGETVEGTLVLSGTTFEVRGTTVDGTLGLQGGRTTNSEIVQLTSWSTRRDILGRMTGSFGVSFVFPGIRTSTGETYSTSYRLIELDSVERVE